MQQDQLNNNERNHTNATEQGKEFYDEYYHLLSQTTSKMIFGTIIRYHSLICERYTFLRPVNREEKRNMKKYFEHFSEQKDEILDALRNLINDGIIQ